MLAQDLKKNDKFIVTGHTDPDGPYRVCLENDGNGPIKFGFPNKKDFWCFMGQNCEVTLVDPSKGGIL